MSARVLSVFGVKAHSFLRGFPVDVAVLPRQPCIDANRASATGLVFYRRHDAIIFEQFDTSDKVDGRQFGQVIGEVHRMRGDYKR